MSRSRPVRLLYVGGFDFPGPHARVIQSLHTAHALARAGWSVRLVAQRPAGRIANIADDPSLAAFGLAGHPRLRIQRLPVLRPRPLPGVDIHVRLALTNWSYGLRALAVLLRERRAFDLVLTRDPRIAWIFLVTRALHRCPVLYEVHELFSTRPRDNVSLAADALWGVARRTRTLEATVLAGANLLLPLTEACAGLLEREHGVPRARLAVVPDATTAPPSELPALDSASARVAYAGQLYAWKGVDTLLQAVGRLPTATLDVVGGLGRDDPNLAAARCLAADLGIGDRVHFEGFVPHARVRGILVGARAGLVPLPDRLMSRYFTSPLKLFDYMAAGVPVVASDLPAIREVLCDGENGLLVPPGDPDALAAAVGRLLADTGLAEALRRRAFDDVRQYTWERRAERIIRAAAPLL